MGLGGSRSDSRGHIESVPVDRYVALTGDVVGSRHLEDRAGFQRRIRELLVEMNRELAAGGEGENPLATELRLTAGDELQGLLSRPEVTVDILVRLADELHPVRMVWGIGVGRITTELRGDVALLDGPCFHRARKAVEQAAAEGAWARLAGFGVVVDQTLSALFRLMGAVREGWTDTQARYVRNVRGRLQKEVAERFDVSPSVVSESLKAARYRELAEAEEAARALLARFGATNETSSPERDLNPALDRPNHLA